MRAFTAHVLSRGEANIDDLEAGIELMVLRGGDLTTNLLDAGVLPEAVLLALLAELNELEPGPGGQLPAPAGSSWDEISRADALRFRVFPLGREGESLVLAVDAPKASEQVKALTDRLGCPLAFRQVMPLRLDEALYRYAEGPLAERERWLLAILNAGHMPRRGDRERLTRGVIEAAPATAPYRRMSEHPEGIARSSRQPEPRLPDPDSLVPEVERRLAEPVEGAPSTRPYHDVPPGGSEPPVADRRITQPYLPGEAEKRNTQPWNDEDEEPPLSVSGEFSASLSAEAAPSVEARIHEDHRRFRHRGPFTRAQAELAASQAADVNTVLEILVRYARQFFERCILFTVTGREVELRLSHGLTAELATLRLSLDQPGLLSEAFRKGDPIVWSLGQEGSDALLRRKLGVQGEQSISVVPLCIRERVVAIFYGDDRTEDVDATSVEDVTDFTEICAVEVTRIIVAKKRGD